MARWWPLLTVCLGSFMLLVDVSIVNVALPDMALDLSTSFSALQWVVDVYALVLAAALLGAGTLGDRWGHRRLYLAGLLVFGLASLASGLAGSASLLVTARAVQGLGAAAMFATTFALLNASYTGRDRGAAYGIWGAVSAAAAALGPIVGGLLTEGLSWRWIFFVNLPVVVVTVVLCLTVLAGDRGGAARRLDLPGTAAFTVFAAALVYGFIEAGSRGWSDPVPVVAFVVALVALALFAARELRTSEPMFDLSLLRHRVFAGTLLAAAGVSLVSFADLVFVSIWLQSVRGMSPIQAGLAGGLPLSAAALVMSSVGARRLHGAPPHRVIAVGIALTGIGSLVMAFQLHGAADWTSLIAGQVLVGLGVGTAIPVLSSAGMAVVPPARAGMAAGAINTARQFALALGIAVLGTVLTSSLTSSLSARGLAGAPGLAGALAGGQARAVAPGLGGVGVADEVFVTALRDVALSVGVVGLVVALAVAVSMRPGRAASPARPGEPARAGTGGEEVVPVRA